METTDLKELIGILKDTDITELQIEKDGFKVKIKREKYFVPQVSFSYEKPEKSGAAMKEDVARTIQD